MDRLETPRYHLKRCVSGASLDTVLLRTVKRSFISEKVTQTERLVLLLRRSVKTGLLEQRLQDRSQQ